MSVLTKLQKTGIPCESYRAGPLGKNNFAINQTSGKIRVWEGEADVEVKTNKRKRQCLINSTENSRSINGWTQEISLNRGQKIETVKEATEAFKKEIGRNNNIRDYCGISVPNSTIRVVMWKITERFNYHSDKRLPHLKLKVVFRTRKTQTSFLVGYDESSASAPFICQLKNMVDTIEEAYQELLPPNTKLHKDHKRQGEWFLNPVSQALNLELMEDVHKAKESPLDGKDGFNWFEVQTRSSHRGLMLKKGRKRYVLGRVRDTRRGRHEPVMLGAWHEVIRNNEVINVSSRTWD